MYWVYILASKRNGRSISASPITWRRDSSSSRLGLGSKFVEQYGVYRLVYVENYSRAEEAIVREKQMKKWNRAWKIRLIERENLEWRDLADVLV